MVFDSTLSHSAAIGVWSRTKQSPRIAPAQNEPTFFGAAQPVEPHRIEPFEDISVLTVLGSLPFSSTKRSISSKPAMMR